MPDRTNRTGSDTQGAFGDQEKQEKQGQGETRYDKDSTLDLPGEKNTPTTSEKPAAKSSASQDKGR